MSNLNTGLTPREQQFFKAFSHLLQEYDDMDGKFSLWKVHKHFTLQDNEVLHETSDTYKRESTVRVIDKSDLPQNAFVSQWLVSKDGSYIQSSWCCD